MCVAENSPTQNELNPPKNAVQRMRETLYQRWPELFDFNAPKPLAIGIFEDLLKALPEERPSHLKRTLNCLCNRSTYLRALQAGATRYGLNGPQGEVTAEHEAFAKQRLERLRAECKASHQAKKAAQVAQKAAKEAGEARRAQKQAAEQAKKRQDAAKRATEGKGSAHKQKPAGGQPSAPVVIVKKRRVVIPTNG